MIHKLIKVFVRQPNKNFLQISRNKITYRSGKLAD